LTVAEPEPGGFSLVVILAGQMSVFVSLTVTVKMQVASVFPPASVAVQVTVVVPIAKKEFEAGSQVTVPQPCPAGGVV